MHFFYDFLHNAYFLLSVSWRRMVIICAILSPLLCHAASDARSVMADQPSVRVLSDKGTTIGHLQDQRLNEISGMGVASDGSGHLWMLNDGGSGSILYRVSPQGRILQRFDVAKNGNRDWEDLAVFTWRNQSFLLIADVGDNGPDRKQVELVVVAEPSLLASLLTNALSPEKSNEAPVKKQLLPWKVQRYRYAQGPRDCEAIAVDVLADKVYFLTKRTQPVQLFSAPLSQLMAPDSPTAPSVQVLTLEAELPTLSESVADPLIRSLFRFVANWPTAMSIDAGQQRAVILTYGFLYFYQRAPNQSWPQAFAKPLAVQVLSQLAQAESVTFADQNQVLVVSEGLGSRILSWQFPSR